MKIQGACSEMSDGRFFNGIFEAQLLEGKPSFQKAWLLLYNRFMDKPPRYKTIFFDWSKTLSNSLFWSQLADPGHERHGWHKNITDFVFVENKKLVEDWMRGKLDRNDVADRIFEKFGYPQKIVLEDLAESCRKMSLVSGEVLELFGKLREKGIKCVVATDNMDTFQKYTKPALELERHFDGFLVSFERKILKFDVEENSIPFFDSYLESEGLMRKDVLLMDDRVDESGTYERLDFEILQVFGPEDFVKKLKKINETNGKKHS